MTFLGIWGIISNMRESRFQVDLTTNSYLFSDFLSLQ